MHEGYGKIENCVLVKFYTQHWYDVTSYYMQYLQDGTETTVDTFRHFHTLW